MWETTWVGEAQNEPLNGPSGPVDESSGGFTEAKYSPCQQKALEFQPFPTRTLQEETAETQRPAHLCLQGVYVQRRLCTLHI